ncbi:MAG: D-alanyl-D-alanine carboxypeptidase family protein [Eubacteriales bacterium]|nr:D-alanyl-D-alanine carboxypeptidase family protein [Eubacteriales bacterium]
MFRKKFLRLAVCAVLCTCMLTGQPYGLYAASDTSASDTSGTGTAAATPTPENHTQAYNEAADTDAIEGWPEGPKIEAESAILMDVVTEAVLYSKNADKQQYPASITKIMTALLACENLDMNGSMVVSESAAYGIEPGSSTIYAETDEQLTYEQAMMGLMLESANEMALALAEETSGSTKKFVELMNRRAAQLGCTNTHFNNPNGLPDETHYTTANDMAKIAKAAWFNPLFRKFVTEDYYEIPPTNKQPETRYLLNHHKMMAGREYAYDGVLGGKTGYTDVAGSTLVTYAKRGNTILMAVVLKSINGAYSDTAALLDYGFNCFEKKDLNLDKEPVPVKNLPSEKYILKNCGNTFPFYYQRRVYVTVPVGTDVSSLAKRQAVLFNSVGPLRMKSKYYFNKQMVGWGMQYERSILTDLLL